MSIRLFALLALAIALPAAATPTLPSPAEPPVATQPAPPPVRVLFVTTLGVEMEVGDEKGRHGGILGPCAPDPAASRPLR